jgi:hypothetical protein
MHMGFFEFDEADEWVETGSGPAPRAASPPPRRAPASSGASPRPPAPGAGGPRPVTPANRPSQTGGRPTTSPQTTAPRPDNRPATRPTTPTTSAGTRPAASGSGFGAIFDRLPGLIDQGIGLVTTGIDVAGRGAQIAQQFQRPAPGAPPPAAGPEPVQTADAPFPIAPGPEPAPGSFPSPAADPGPAAPQPAHGAPAPTAMAPAGAPARGYDQLAVLLQALQQRQIPPLPGPAAPPGYPGYPSYYAPPMPQQNDPFAMLSAIVGNPQFQQALQWSAAMGQGGPRSVQLPLPAPGYPGDARSVAIPMGAVMNTIAALAGQSRSQINATTREDEAEVPEYLVDDRGDFIVDPARPDDRAALVAHLFRVSDEASRSGWFETAGAEAAFDKESESESESEEAEDESEQWAREAGFTR